MDEDSKSQGGLKWLLAAGGAGAAAPFFLGLDTKAAVAIALAVVGLLVVLVGGYFLWVFWKKKRAKGAFDRSLGESVSGAPPGVDAKGLAELDAMRRKYQEGIQAYKSRGKDLYSLPWYLLVGEPSAGKTEAVRHCGVGFPPGLTDQLQGVGGTINMHWWFTNSAVILDTAGKMLFSNVKPGESGLWQDFLKLLKKSRPHCPINGLLLVLPVNSLIKDSANKIGEKAAVIAKQIDLIQRTLDVRFPVFLLVTKCDLLTGFREYFEGMDDIEATQQIFGWSNPDPLDAPFRPELVDQHLDTVAQRLRRRRLAMLRDPAERGPANETRAEAVDSLFALPQSLLLIAPRLKRYLQTIFVAGEWAPKPVFLRGIYFCSSFQQGSPLDEALAALRGVSMEEMREEMEGARTERTFFLYDLFTEKIFKERGLVTRATNTLTMLRRRRWTLLGAAAAVLLAWAGISTWGFLKFHASIGKESEDWELAAAPTNWIGGTWKPIVTPAGDTAGSPPYRFSGDEQFGAGRSNTLVQFHTNLHAEAGKSISVPLVFWPVKVVFGLTTDDLNTKEPQRVIFERGVLKPLLDAARSRMQAGVPDESTNLAPALVTLIQIEKDLLPESQERRLVLYETNAVGYLKSLTAFLTGSPHEETCSNLAPVFVSTYNESKAQLRGWSSGGSTFATNTPIERGLDQFLANSRISLSNLETRLGLLEKIRKNALEFQQSETNLLIRVAFSPDKAAELLSGLETAGSVLSQAISNGRRVELRSDDAAFLRTNHQTLIEESIKRSAGPYAELNTKALPNSRLGIFGEIRKRLAEFQTSMGTSFQAAYDTNASVVTHVDREILAEINGKPLYTARTELYRRAVDYKQNMFPVDESVIGNAWLKFAQIGETAESTLAVIRSTCTGQLGPHSNVVVTACYAILQEGQKEKAGHWIEDYVSACSNALRKLGQTGERVDSAFLGRTNEWLAALEKDLGPAELSKPIIPPASRFRLVQLSNQLAQVRLDLIKKYAGDLRLQLTNQLGFPVVWDSDKLLTYHSITNLKGFCDDVSRQFDRLRTEKKYSLEPLQRLEYYLKQLDPALKALAGTSGIPPKVAVRMNIKDNFYLPPGTKPGLGLASKFDKLRISFGTKRSDPVPINNYKPIEEVDIPLTGTLGEPIGFELEGPDGSVGPHSISGGMVEWLKRAGPVPPIDTEKGTWKLSVPMLTSPDEFGRQNIELKVVIGEAGGWPSQESWPRFSSFR